LKTEKRKKRRDRKKKRQQRCAEKHFGESNAAKKGCGNILDEEGTFEKTPKKNKNRQSDHKE